MQTWLPVAIFSALLMSPLAPAAVAHDLPAGVKLVTPADLKWTESPRAPGVQVATVVGDPNKPGPYVIRAKYPPNLVNPPHHHPLDEEITVIAGALYLGHGETMEPGRAIAVPAGSVIFEPAKTVHYFFTTSEPADVEIRGTGPRANIFAK